MWRIKNPSSSTFDNDVCHIEADHCQKKNWPLQIAKILIWLDRAWKVILKWHANHVLKMYNYWDIALESFQKSGGYIIKTNLLKIIVRP